MIFRHLKLVAVLMVAIPAAAQWQPVGSPYSGSIYHNGGSVGIGVVQPLNTLDVHADDAAITIKKTSAAVGDFILFRTAPGTVASFSRISGYGLFVKSSSGEALGIWQSAHQPIKFITNGAERMHIDRDGMVGIGTVSPVNALEVHSPSAAMTIRKTSDTAGDYLVFQISGGTVASFTRIASHGLFIKSSSDEALGIWHTDAKPIKFVTAGAQRILIDGNGKVGIGAGTPSAQLHVTGDIRFGSNGSNTDLLLATAAPQTILGVQYQQVNTITPVTVPAPGQTTRTAVYLKNGTAAGQGTNEIDLVVDGAISATYQDVAEWVSASTDMVPGTVVVLSSESDNVVEPSGSPYDTRVAGVVSARPGIVLGRFGTDKEQIATTGRVRVRVDATKAPIARGDLLVTGDLSGTAMKSTPVDVAGMQFHRPGTIVGKALEPLASGTGEILVLLSLQ